MNKYRKGGYVEPKKEEVVMLKPWPIGGPLRPCIVEMPGKKYKNALFHRWIEKSEIVPPSPMVGGHSGGVLQFTLAIVEFEDGSVRKILPERIKFADNEIQKYCFRKENERFKHGDCSKCMFYTDIEPGNFQCTFGAVETNENDEKYRETYCWEVKQKVDSDDAMDLGMLLAYQSVKEEIDTILHELSRKGFEEPKGFSVIKAFVEDNIKEIGGIQK
ncbi:MAG: hypothetical protein PHT84_00190 [Candidatus Pacebacteria bacterium]|nr:hypothetical protein [Candidatus Paceibacterota bacterium]